MYNNLKLGYMSNISMAKVKLGVRNVNIVTVRL